MNDNMETINEVEDFLQEHKVFRNGFDYNKRANPGSYGSAFDFASFDSCKKQLQNSFSKEQLMMVADYFENVIGYLSPTLILTGITIRKLVSQKPQGLEEGIGKPINKGE